ncbi:hypothetical protein [Streptomyces sp. NPDC048191]|uniref:hypothetical protein n=1 Tax=Streptomyces sp. NPDC048191 TaxID=3155484 RepID=UPI0033FA5CA2
MGTEFSSSVTIAETVQFSLSVMYQHSWLTTHTETYSSTLPVPKGYKGWIDYADVVQHISGTWQTHYDDRHWGHYFWYVHDNITHPVTEGTDGQRRQIIPVIRPMTSADWRSCAMAPAKGTNAVAKKATIRS